jgi:hypothetical protein
MAGRAVVLVRRDNHGLAEGLQRPGKNGKARGTDAVVVGHKYQWGHFFSSSLQTII